MKCSRRNLLLGGGAVVGLPWLRHLHTPQAARAQSMPGALTADGFPKRLLIFFKGNGVFHDTWFPQPGGNSREFSLGESTEPLAPFKDRLLFLDGVDNRVIIDQPKSPGEDHNKGAGSLLTGYELNEGDILGADGSSRADYTKGPSVDQLIARAVGAQTAIPSLQVGAMCEHGNLLSRAINFEGNKRPILAQGDPAAVFRQVFSNRSVPIDERRAMRDKRRSVLDFVSEEFSEVAKNASAEDRPRLEEHQAFIRDIESRLSGERFLDCRFPDAPPELGYKNQNNMEQVLHLQRDLVTHAFACDLTRVATVMVGNGANQLTFPFFDSFGNDHVLAHEEHTDADGARAKRRPRHRWYMEQLHDILARLDSFPEGEGTLLDHTLVLFCSENTNGWHQHHRHPFILAGGLGGYFRQGELLHFDRASHTDLLISLAEAFGVQELNIGNPDFANGPLPGIRA